MVAEAARSRQLLAQSRRALWGAAKSEEEARAYLQQRLNLYSKTMFWSFIALLVFLSVMYEYWAITPKYYRLVFGGAAVLLAVMAGIWRIVLARGTPSVDTLYRIDLLFASAIGSAFGASAALQFDMRPAGYTSMLFACFTVFTRALLIPSSARRTAVVASVTFVPIMIASVYLSVTTKQDLPPAALIGGAVLFCVVAIVIAANGSGIIYGLRQQVTEAMQLGEYTLDRKIGEGGMGAVYRASHALLRRPTAIKLLLPEKVGPENLDRFEREVQHMSQLTHPNTVTVFDYGRSPEGVLYYAMEYLGGINLEQLVKRFGPQPAGRVAKILVQVSGALQEAHDNKIIHRDIKPANIILCERGGVPDVAKVVDFGLVKEITRDTTASTQMVMGTPHYLAPEAITDPDRLSTAVDLYGLGAVGYFLLTGRHVFDGKTSVQVCMQQVTEQPQRPSEAATVHVPRELEDLIMKCLSKSPDERPTAASFAESLEALPKPRDWDHAEAKRWWRELKAAEAVPTSEAPTLTITIDLHQRT